MKNSKYNNTKYVIINHAILTIVTTIGVIFGIGGIGHGFFEILQGNIATNSVIIHAIGDANRMWLYGNEPAFSIIPNFMITGIVAISVGIIIIIWSLWFMHKKHASSIFLSLFILLFLVGGGIGQIVFFIIGWLMSTRISKPLSWWSKVLSVNKRKFLLKFWQPCLIVSTLFILYTLQIAIFGFVPGVSNPNHILMLMFITLGSGLLFLLLAFITGCAYDIEMRRDAI